jgi:hypothetical protein
MDVRGAARIWDGPDRPEAISARCIGRRLTITLKVFVERPVGAVVLFALSDLDPGPGDGSP